MPKIIRWSPLGSEEGEKGLGGNLVVAGASSVVWEGKNAGRGGNREAMPQQRRKKRGK